MAAGRKFSPNRSIVALDSKRVDRRDTATDRKNVVSARRDSRSLRTCTLGSLLQRLSVLPPQSVGLLSVLLVFLVVSVKPTNSPCFNNLERFRLLQVLRESIDSFPSRGYDKVHKSKAFGLYRMHHKIKVYGLIGTARRRRFARFSLVRSDLPNV